MDEHNNDPYEQQLYVVFKSCLAEGQLELQEDDWHILCHKLHLTDHSDELKSYVQRHKTEKGTISFVEFRNALLILLGKSQELIAQNDGDISVESRTVLDFYDSNVKGKKDGLLSLNEILDIFHKKKDLVGDIRLERNDELGRNFTKLETNNCDADTITSRKSRNNRLADIWKISGMPTLLSHSTFEAADTSLPDLTASLCDELKSIHESLEHSEIRSHLSLLRDVLLFYQEELHKSRVTIENLNCEKEKLRIDIAEANERANSLALQNDEQHIQKEEIKQKLRKEIEQRYVEAIHELSNQLNTEREQNCVALKSKDDQLQSLQKEINLVRSKHSDSVLDYQSLQLENEHLQSQIDLLKHSNYQLHSQMKILVAEHDEAESFENKQQQQITFLVERIKQLQSETVSLRDQNDELSMELETLKLRDCHVKDTRVDNQIKTESHLGSGEHQDETEGLSMDDEVDFDILMHSTMISCSDNKPEENSSKRKSEAIRIREHIAKQLTSLVTNNNKCNSEICKLRNDILAVIKRLQSNTELSSPKEADLGKSIASELETECENRTSESLRDFVVSKNKNCASIKRLSPAISANDVCSENENNMNNYDSKSSSPSKTPSLRDYPPRKEETVSEHLKASKDRSSVDSSTKSRTGSVKTDSMEDVNETTLKLQELEATYSAEKKQLSEQCSNLEKSLELLKLEYEESENYWTAKFEEERQLFEQEQKINDEKLSELIAKIAEYEELITADESKNGRLSPIEEKFNLEQQYLDLEDEFEKWKAQAEHEIFEKDQEIKDLCDKLKSTEKRQTVDNSVQVTYDELSLQTPQNYVPTSSFSLWSPSDSTSKLSQCSENLRKLPDEFKLDRILESSGLPNDLINQVTKQEMGDYSAHQLRSNYTVSEMNGTSRSEKSSSLRKKREMGAKSAVLMKEENKHDVEYELLQEALRLQNLKSMNCHCIQSNTQVCCVDMNSLQSLTLRLQANEREKRQLQEYFRKYQRHIENVLHRLITQHQVEISELQCLLRTTQERLQIQFQTNTEQADKLARADILVKDLYIENSCLSASMKRLEQHCQILTGFSAQSTSI